MKTLRSTVAAVLALGLASALLASNETNTLESTPQVKAYRALLAAMRAGDYAAYKRWMVKEAGARMDETNRQLGKDPKDVLTFMAVITPPEIAVTDMEVDGPKAILHASGKLEGEMNYGTVELSREDGQWRVGLQSWTNKAVSPSLVARARPADERRRSS